MIYTVGYRLQVLSNKITNDQLSKTKNFDLERLDIGYYLVIGIWLLVI
jgi:hypothetical protein